MWIYQILFIHSPLHMHLDCFHYLAIMNNAVMDIYVQVFVWTCFHSHVFMPRKEIAVSWGYSVIIFLKNCQISFQSDCTILHSHQQCLKVQFLHSLASTCYYVFFFFFIIAILVDMKLLSVLKPNLLVVLQ